MTRKLLFETDDHLAQRAGFDGVDELLSLTIKALSIRDAYDEFLQWFTYDGSKTGLLALLDRYSTIEV